MVCDVYVRRAEKQNGKMVNKTIKTYHKVSQFWTMEPEDVPPATGVLARLPADEGLRLQPAGRGLAAARRSAIFRPGGSGRRGERDVAGRQIQPAQRIQHPAHHLRAVLRTAYRRQDHRAGDARILRQGRLQAAGDLDVLSQAASRPCWRVGLFFDIYTRYVGFIAFIHLLVAAAATYKVTKSWIWVIGGIEYCVFWAICCLVVAMHASH